MSSLEDLLSEEGFPSSSSSSGSRWTANRPPRLQSGSEASGSFITAGMNKLKIFSRRNSSAKLIGAGGASASGRRISLQGKPHPLGGTAPAPSSSMDSRSKVHGSFIRRHDNPSYHPAGGAAAGDGDAARGARRDDEVAGDEDPTVPPPLDEAAILAVAAITTGYTKRFFKDQDFRASLRQSCLSSLQPAAADEDKEEKQITVVAKLMDAAETIERSVAAAPPPPNPKEIKKVSVQLTVIAGLGSDELKDGFTSGIPNLLLSACAHLYLGLIYQMLKKYRVAAKHLLQVFCDSPELGRKTLLPALWNHLLFPHLAKLRVWYDDRRREERLPETTMKAMDDAYSDALDVGTRKFAQYYKEWLKEDREPPEVPTVDVPCVDQFVEHLGADLEVEGEEDSGEEEVVDKEAEEAECQSEVKGDKEGIEEENGGSSPSSSTHSPRIDIEEVEEVVIYDHTTTTSYPDQDTSSQVQEWMDKETYSNVRRPSVAEEMVFDVECDSLRPWPASDHSRTVADAAGDSSIHHHHHHQLKDLESLKPDFLQNSAESMNNNSPSSSISTSSTEVFDLNQETNGGFESIPKDFICPLTGKLFKDPVIIETGETFDRQAFNEWLRRGETTCPATGRPLNHPSSPPLTNQALKRVIDGWKSEHCQKLLSFAAQMATDARGGRKSKGEAALFIMEQLLASFNAEEQVENARHVVSFGGLRFFAWVLETGDVEEKARAASLLLSCVKVDSSCRSFLATNIRAESILGLLQSDQIAPRTAAASLMTELITLKRSNAMAVSITSSEAMRHLLAHLQSSSSPEEKAQIGVLLLNLDLSVIKDNSPVETTGMCSIYRDEAVDAIADALDGVSSPEGKLTPSLRRTILMLGGCFSSSGEANVESWLLKRAGFHGDFDKVGNLSRVDEGEKELEREEWMKNMALTLLCNGGKKKKGASIFLEALSRGLGSGNPELARICLVTAAWMSFAASSSLPNADGFSALVPFLMKRVGEDEQVENRVLASLSLLNIIKITECRVLLMTFAKEMLLHIHGLQKVTWTAQRLYNEISQELAMGT